MKNILIVDDDSNYLGIVREWLKDKYKVFVANSGQRALAWLSSNKPDLILLDYEMPDLNGPEVYGRIKENPELKAVPVIFLTGREDAESITSVLSINPEGYVFKTNGREELLSIVKGFLK